jgi:coproporphyrinogen III oxidase-like Fe-S oxidoreductase
MRERIMVGLRRAAGVPEDLVVPVLEALPGLAERVREFEELGLARRRQGRLVLSPRGWLLSNELLQELWSMVD